MAAKKRLELEALESSFSASLWRVLILPEDFSEWVLFEITILFLGSTQKDLPEQAHSGLVSALKPQKVPLPS
jgi:hypothetical protein